MVHHARLRLDVEHPEAVAQAVALEVADGPEGSSAHLRVEADALDVVVEADTVSSLRAALNSVVRLLDAAARTP